MNKQMMYRQLLTEKFIPPTETNFIGNMYWKNKYGELHSVNGQPAVIYTNGNRYWYKNGKCHRDGDKPAIINSNGSKFWYKNGKCHRDGDKPAIIYSSGDKEWFKNGKIIKRKMKKMMYKQSYETAQKIIIKKRNDNKLINKVDNMIKNNKSKINNFAKQ